MTALASPSSPAPMPTAPRRFPLRLNATFIRETGWLAGGFASKLVINLGTLYFLTHNLGVTGSGTFFALISLLACLVPFVQLGNYDLTVRDIARQVDPQLVAGRAMRSSAAAFLCVLPVLALLKPFLAHDVGWAAFLMVTVGELLVMRVISNVQAVATGFRQHYVTAVSDFVLGASRLAAIYLAWRWGAGVNLVLMLYAFTALPAAAVTYGWLVRRIGRPHLTGGAIFSEMADHLRMVVAWFAEMAAREGDKPLLKWVAGDRQTGIYGTATKLFSVMLVPIDVLTQVLRPRLGRAFIEGEEPFRRLYRLMAVGLFGCGVATGAGLVAVAMLLPRFAPRLTGGEFAEVRLAMIYLSFVPPIYGLQRANIIAAISRGATSAYARGTAVSAIVGVSTLLLFGHAHGWRAACVASQVYLGTSCLVTWLLTRAANGRPAAGADEVDAALPELEAAAAS